MKDNPVLILCGGIGVVVTTGIALVVAFGLSVSAGQSAAIVAFVSSVTALITALVTRQKVAPMSHVRALKRNDDG